MMTHFEITGKRIGSRLFLTMLSAVLMVGICSAQPSGAAREAAKRGLTQLRAGDVSAAINAYSEAIRLDPKWAPAWLGRSLSHAVQNGERLKKALGSEHVTLSKPIEDDYVQALQLDPNPHEAYRQWAGGQSQQEVQQLIQVIEQLAAVHSGASMALMTENKYDESLAEAARAIQLLPDNPLLRFKRGSFLTSLRQWDKAIAELNEVERIARLPKTNERAGVQLAPDDKTRTAYLHLALTTRGKAYRGKGELPRSLADLNEAVRANQGSSESARACAAALRERGITYLAMNDREKALADLTEAIRLDPSDEDAVFQRAILWADRNQSDKALTDISEAIRLAPWHAEAHYLRGYVHMQIKEPAKAISDFNEAIRLAPQYQAAYFHRALAHLASGNADLSLADSESALRMHDNGRKFNAAELLIMHDSRGRAYELKGEAPRAKTEFAKADQYRPPAIIRTTPTNGAVDVDPSLTVVTVVFDRAMRTDSWIVMPVGNALFPELVGTKPLAFSDDRTVVLKVRVKPATEYTLGFNTSEHPGFQSASANVRAQPFQLRFKTASAPVAAVDEGPSVVKLEPSDGTRDLEAGTLDLIIVFDEPMKQAEATLNIPEGSTPLRIIGKPRWKDPRTWVVTVLLAPGTTYRVGINTGNQKPFASAGDGTPSLAKEWSFQTASDPPSPK